MRDDAHMRGLIEPRLSRRRLLVRVGAAAGVLSAAYYLLFVQFLGIPLPSGVWSKLWAAAAS